VSNWPGNLIRKTPVTPAGPFQDGAASGVWSLAEASYWTKQGLWPIPGNLAPLGMFGGGNSPASSSIQSVNISTTSNAASFGNLTNTAYRFASFASSTRAVWAGGEQGNIIDFISISSGGAATDFGDLITTSNQNLGVAGFSNNIRGVIAGGNYVNIIQYVTIASAGNATDFGDLTVARGENPGTGASSTRGLIAGGSPGSGRNISTDYVTIASTGNATSFGNLTVARQDLAGFASETRAVMGGGYTASAISAVMDYYTIASTGTATSFGNLLSVTTSLAGCASPTRGLFGGGYTAGFALTNVIQYVTIASTGNALDFGDLTSANNALAACSGAAEAVQPTPTSSAMALFGGGTAAPGGDTQAGIQYVNITTTGNAYFFGQLTTARYSLTGFASSTRGVFSGGEYGNSFKNVIDYVTIASLGNATTFGTLTANGRYALGGASNDTRGLSFAGYNASTGPGFMNVIDYVTIATTGNATDFGDTTVVNAYLAACASTTRATYAGGYDGSNAYVSIGYVTIATTGNATSFGNLSAARLMLSSCSSATRGLFAGGRTSAGSGYPANSNIIDYITIASTGNATDFGDLTVARAQLAAASSSTTAVFAGGQNTSGASVNTIDYVTIASTGNATDFGDLSSAYDQQGGCSNAHGGL